MKKAIILLFAFLPISFLLFAQEAGIQFSHGISWEEIKLKAQKENKYIFVDCFATWCQPCKIMDTQVYSNDSIGAFVNAHYVSVKIQMDSTKNDDIEVIQFFQTARLFEKEYSISELPTFLYFSPEGVILHKELGGKSASQFMGIMVNTLDSQQQIYALIEQWNKHRISYANMPALIKKLYSYNEKEAADAIAKDYIVGYLEKISEEEFLEKQNLEFLADNIGIITPASRVFTYYYGHAGRVDAIMEETGYSQKMVSEVIYNHEMRPYLKAGNQNKKEDLDWRVLRKELNKKYRDDIVVLIINNAKIGWYRKQKKWDKYTKSIVEQIHHIGFRNAPTSGLGAGVFLNSAAWEVFTYSHNKKELRSALAWVNYALSIYPNIIPPGSDKPFPLVNPMDTKANLLYKLGRIKQALFIQGEAVKLQPNMTKTLDKMKQGIPTWYVEGAN